MKRRRIIIAALLVAVLGCVAWMMLRPDPREPRYEGITVSYWLRNLRHGSGFKMGRYPQMDSNAVPYLVKALATRDSLLHREYVNVRRRFPNWLRRRLPEPVDASLVRQNAIYALRSLGSNAAPAIPALVRVLKEDENTLVRYSAALVLGSIGRGDNRVRKAMAEITQDKSQDPFVLGAVTSALNRIDSDAAANAGVK